MSLPELLDSDNIFMLKIMRVWVTISLPKGPFLQKNTLLALLEKRKVAGDLSALNHA